MISFFHVPVRQVQQKHNKMIHSIPQSYRYYSQQIHTFSHAAKYETF